MGNDTKINANVISVVEDNKGKALDEYLNDIINDFNQKITGTVLYNNVSGSKDVITLSDDASNYNYIDIYTESEEGYVLPLIRLKKGMSKFRQSYARYDTGITVNTKVYTVSGKKITPTSAERLYVNGANVVGYTSNDLSEYSRIIKIIKVIGYK